MKKLFLAACLILSITLLSSCTNKPSNTDDQGSITNINTPTPQAIAETQTIADYFSYQPNVRYVYEGAGNEYASYDVFVDYLAGNRVQLRTNNGGTELAEVLENKDGALTVLLSKGEVYYRENFTAKTFAGGDALLKEPLTKGTEWVLADGSKRSITNTNVDMTTPLGSYKTLEVTTEAKDSKTVDYYAANIGLVKSVFTANGDETSAISSTLIKMENNVPFVQTVKFYYPNVIDDKINYVEKKLSFNTNDITKMVFEKAFKDVPKGNVGKVLSANAKIKSLYLNKDNRVYIDFSKELVTEMNAGSGYESMILQSIVNTFGEYYGVDKVYLTVEGSPYSSGHILMQKGEFFTVNLKNSFEMK